MDSPGRFSIGTSAEVFCPTIEFLGRQRANMQKQYTLTNDEMLSYLEASCILQSDNSRLCMCPIGCSRWKSDEHVCGCIHTPSNHGRPGQHPTPCAVFSLCFAFPKIVQAATALIRPGDLGYVWVARCKNRLFKDLLEILYGWWKKSCTNWYDHIPLFTGFIHPRWCRNFSINSMFHQIWGDRVLTSPPKRIEA